MFKWLLNKLRSRRNIIQINTKRNLIFGTIYKITRYQNYKRDPAPLIYVMYSGQMNFKNVSGHYTDGININYLGQSDKLWLAKIIQVTKSNNQQMNGAVFYRFLKSQKPNIIRMAYRRYHTNMIKNPRMVSAGITHLNKLVYPYNDPFIKSLNNMTSQSKLNRFLNNKIGYNSGELRERIINAQNSKPVSQLKQTKQAPWIKKV